MRLGEKCLGRLRYPASVLEIQSNLTLLLSLVLFAVKALALVDCVARPADRFRVVDTLDKNAWLVILVLALLAHVFISGWNPLGIFSLVGTVAALVYLAQLRGSSA